MRIPYHIFLRYPDLDATSRRQIWTQLFSNSNKAGFSENDLEEMAGLQPNGRQIKNVLKTASLFARKQGIDLSCGRIQTVMKVRASVL